MKEDVFGPSAHPSCETTPKLHSRVGDSAVQFIVRGALTPSRVLKVPRREKCEARF